MGFRPPPLRPREGAPSRAQKLPSGRQLHVRQCAMGRQVTGRLKCFQHSARMFAVAFRQDKTFLINSKTWVGNIPTLCGSCVLTEARYDNPRMTLRVLYSRWVCFMRHGWYRHVLLRLMTTATFLYKILFLHWPCYGIYKQATVTCPSSTLTIFKSLP